MPSLSTQGHYFLPICPSLVFATERQISRNNRRHNDIKCNVFWVLKILKHKRLGWRTSNEKSWAKHALNWEIQLGDIVRSVILYVPVIHLLALQAVLWPQKRNRATDKQELLQLCDPFSVCKQSICDALEKSWPKWLVLGKGTFPNFYTRCILKTAESTNWNYHWSFKGTLCCSYFYHDWPLQQKRFCYFQMK